MRDGVDLHASGDVEEYASYVTRFLEREPVERNVLLTVIEQARAGWHAWTAQPQFWWIAVDGEVLAAASWTPPSALLVSSMPGEAVASLSEAVLRRAEALGLELTTIVSVPRPDGASCPATAGDAPLVREWMRAFATEAHTQRGGDVEATIRASIDAARIWLWIDGEPRSTASRQPAVGGIVRIGGVYTPPSERGRGYARQLVHDMSVDALRTRGVRGCTLNTDAANPASNAIYAQIGYVPVAEHAQFALRR